LISSAFVNTGKYSIVERSLLDDLLKEAQFTNTDMVDEKNATELGKLAGANKVALSVMTQAGSRYMLSIKLIDVQTATIDKQQSKMFKDIDAVFDGIETMTATMLGAIVPSQAVSVPKPVAPSVSTPSTTTPSRPVATAKPSTAKPQGITRTPIANSAMNIINTGLGAKAARYATDEDKFAAAGVSGQLKKLLDFSLKPVIQEPEIGNDQVLLLYRGAGGRINSYIFVFIDKKMITVGSVSRGFLAVLPNDDKPHIISIWISKRKNTSENIQFSNGQKYEFVWSSGLKPTFNIIKL
jgi:hypothetical protein